MKRKKFKHKLLIIIGCVLLLVACGKQETPTSSSATTSEAPIVAGEGFALPRDVDVQTMAAVQARDDVFVLDVREQWEYNMGHLSDAAHIPIGEVSNRLNEIPSDKNVIIYCATGARSNQVTTFLEQNGYTNIHNMLGGISAWQRAGLPVAK